MKLSVFLQFVLCVVLIVCDKHVRIIIVGSGASGIAASSILMADGFKNVKILEAENRRGGRILTKKFGKYWVDFGAQWVHGDKDNIIYDLASPLGLLQGGEEYGLKIANKIYGSNGTDILEENVRKISSYDWAPFGNTSEIEKMKIGSIGEYMTIKFNEFIKTFPDVTVDQREEILFLLNRAKMAMDGGNDWNEVSYKAMREYRGISGDYLVNWKNRGYSTIFDILTRKIPNPEEELPVVNNTILNAKVMNINYGDDGPVKLSTADGKEYLADHVIFTGSLGVLKADHKKLFTPHLPKKKINAIKNLGFGMNSLIYLLYDEPWWKPESNFAKGMLWARAEKAELDVDPIRNWMLGVYMAITIEHKPKLLCLRMSGKYSREMERVPQELFKNQTLELIRKFFGRDYNITDPKRIKRTTWNTNKNIRGSYSFRSVNSDNFNAKNEDLAEPLMRNGIPIIQFAGEATDHLRYSTVQGAVMSGIREAIRLVEIHTPLFPEIND